jgi:lysylphosphatidylglycerol synthetase-like protein (DUF2156 family)
MDKKEFNAVMRTLQEQSNLLSEKRSAWRHQLLVAASALFGILISLQSTGTQSQCTRLAFALAIVLLALGILSTAIALYEQIDAIDRSRKAYSAESQAAFREGREMKPVAVRARKLFSFCAGASYICFGLSVLLLAVYAVLSAL